MKKLFQNIMKIFYYIIKNGGNILSKNQKFLKKLFCLDDNLEMEWYEDKRHFFIVHRL